MFEEVKQTPAGSAVEPSLYQQIKDFFEEKGVKMPGDFESKLNAYQKGQTAFLLHLGLYFKLGKEVPESPKFALLCLAEGGKSGGHEGAMVHFRLAMREFNLDELDLSDKQKEEFQQLNGIFEEKIEEQKIENYKREISYIEEYPELLNRKGAKECLAKMKEDVAEYEGRHASEEEKSNTGRDQGRY